MPNAIETTLGKALSESDAIGQIFIQRLSSGGFSLCHHDDKGRHELETFRKPEDAVEIARYDGSGNYRALKTAPNLRRGWRMEVEDIGELRRALDHFYPGRLAILEAKRQDRLTTTPLRDTLNRQSGMYRIAAKISDDQIDELIGRFCKSNGGCLRTILWKRDASGAAPSTKLPAEKFDPACDQLCSRRPVGDTHASRKEATTIPLLCPEACNLLVAACRNVVKRETSEG